MIQRVLIADDEPLARKRLGTLVHLASPCTDIFEAEDGDAAVDAIAACAPEIVLLNMQMPGRNGFDVIRAVGVGNMPLTVLVTAPDQYAMHGAEVPAVDYLFKPFDDDRFRAAWTRAEVKYAMQAALADSKRLAALIERMESLATAGTLLAEPSKRFADRVVIKKDARTTLVRTADVQWAESKGNYVMLHTTSGDHLVRETLASLESRLDPDVFVRIHRRTIVAIDAIKEVHPWFWGDQVLILRDGRQLRVSRTLRQRVARRLAGQR